MIKKLLHCEVFTRTTHASAVFAVKRWLFGWLSVCHTPVLCLNG